MPADNGEILTIVAGGGPAPRTKGLPGRRGDEETYEGCEPYTR
jgi:hypothetical protein